MMTRMQPGMWVDLRPGETIVGWPQRNETADAKIKSMKANYRFPLSMQKVEDTEFSVLVDADGKDVLASLIGTGTMLEIVNAYAEQV